MYKWLIIGYSPICTTDCSSESPQAIRFVISVGWIKDNAMVKLAPMVAVSKTYQGKQLKQEHLKQDSSIPGIATKLKLAWFWEVFGKCLFLHDSKGKYLSEVDHIHFEVLAWIRTLTLDIPTLKTLSQCPWDHFSKISLTSIYSIWSGFPPTRPSLINTYYGRLISATHPNLLCSHTGVYTALYLACFWSDTNWVFWLSFETSCCLTTNLAFPSVSHICMCALMHTF